VDVGGGGGQTLFMMDVPKARNGSREMMISVSFQP
jgi:hypothetical protein